MREQTLSKLRAETNVIARFAGVGIAATMVHCAVFVMLMETAHLSALSANALAFTAASAISYFGHRRVTFDYRGSKLTSSSRFVVTALSGFLLNSLFSWLVVDVAAYSYWIAVSLMFAATPAITYALLRLWVFSDTCDTAR